MKKENNKIDITGALNDSERVELWLKKNWKKTLIAVIILAIVAVAAFAVYYFNNQKAVANDTALNEADAEKLPELLKKNPESPAANQARLRLAQSLIAKKDFDGAAIQFDLVAISEKTPSEIRSRARMSAAACQEAVGKKLEAAEAYLAIFNDASVSGLARNEAGFNAGRLLAGLNKKQRASEVLKLVAETIQTPGNAASPAVPDMWQSRAQMLLNTL